MKFGKAPAAWAGIIQAIVTLAVVYVPDLPTEAILAFVAATTGLSFTAQKVENGKTLAALYSDPEDED